VQRVQRSRDERGKRRKGRNRRNGETHEDPEVDNLLSGKLNNAVDTAHGPPTT